MICTDLPDVALIALVCLVVGAVLGKGLGLMKEIDLMALTPYYEHAA